MKFRKILLAVGLLSNCVLLCGCSDKKDSVWQRDAKEIAIKLYDGNWKFFVDKDHNLGYKEEFNSNWYRIRIKETYFADEIVYQDFPYVITKY